MFCEHPLLERFEAARACGFDAVEIQFPYDHDASDVANAARNARVQVVLINAPVATDAPFGMGCLPGREADFRAGLDRVLEYAAALGATYVNVLAGQAEGLEPDACRATLVGNLRHAAKRLDGVARVLLEPINAHDVPHYFVDSFAGARQIIAECAGRVGLQFDIYHAARMGLDPLTELAASLDLVRHVQFADAPGRHEPGTGRVVFEPLWALLDGSGYRGFVSAEYRPSGHTRASLGWLGAWRGLVKATDSGYKGSA